MISLPPKTPDPQITTAKPMEELERYLKEHCPLYVVEIDWENLQASSRSLWDGMGEKSA